MKDFFVKRYWLHLLVGLILGYCITYKTDFLEYDTIDKTIGAIIVAIVVYVLAGFFEWFQAVMVKRKYPLADPWDWFDLHYSGIGSLIGSATYFIWQNERFFNFMLFLFVGIWLYEIYRMYVNFKK